MSNYVMNKNRSQVAKAWFVEKKNQLRILTT